MRPLVIAHRGASAELQAVVVSFEAGAAARVRALRPELRTVQHVAFAPMRPAAARGGWAVGFDDRRASRRALHAAQSRGLATTVYTVNEPVRMLELAALGVTGIFTDDPPRALQCLGPRPAG